MEDSFTPKETAQGIADFSLGKSPGPDGFNNRFYKVLGEQLVPFMSKVFNSVSPASPFAPQSLVAHISVLPKPGKEPIACSNFRPVSLIDVDVEIFAKIASKSTPILPSISHNNQVRFMKGREARDNTNKTLLLISHAHHSKILACLLSVDAEKAFDRVHWTFPHGALAQIGAGPVLLGKMMALYSNPSAKIMTNGVLSAPMHIANSSRQGCALSPLLYVLIMENLAVALQSNLDIHGIRVGSGQYKLVLYADYLLL